MLKLFLINFVLMSTIYAKKVNIGYDTSLLEKFTKTDLKVATDVMLTKLLTSINYEGEFSYYDDIKKMHKDLENAKLDYVSLNPLNLIKYFDLTKLEPSFSEGAKDINNLYLVVLVNAKSNIKSYKDFKNKKIFINLRDPVSKMYIDYHYLKANGNLDIYYKNSSSSQNSILKLFFNKADITIVRYKNYTTAIELNPQIAKKVLLFEKTTFRNTQIGMFRKNLDPQIKKMFSKQAYLLDKTVQGRQILDIYKTDKLEETNMKDLRNIKIFYENFIQLKQKINK
mgnify:CR=1 FL=1